jgi:hypothetical protein
LNNLKKLSITKIPEEQKKSKASGSENSNKSSKDHLKKKKEAIFKFKKNKKQ